jgi:hypothetical protein
MLGSSSTTSTRWVSELFSFIGESSIDAVAVRFLSGT